MCVCVCVRECVCVCIRAWWRTEERERQKDKWIFIISEAYFIRFVIFRSCEVGSNGRHPTPKNY